MTKNVHAESSTGVQSLFAHVLQEKYPVEAANVGVSKTVDERAMKAIMGVLSEVNDDINPESYFSYDVPINYELIFETYYESVFSKPGVPVVEKSLEFVTNTIASDIWARNSQELADPGSPINKWIDNLNDKARVNSYEKVAAMCGLRAAVATQNAVNLSGLNLQDHRAVIDDIFNLAFKANYELLR